jgi:hypothetical protein
MQDQKNPVMKLQDEAMDFLVSWTMLDMQNSRLLTSTTQK